MPTDAETAEGIDTTTPPPAAEVGGATPGAAATPAGDAAAAGAATAAGAKGATGGPLMVPPAAMKRIKEEQRQRGRREALAELEHHAKEAGFATVDAMLAAARNVAKLGKGSSQRTAPAADAADAPPPTATATTPVDAPATRDANAPISRREQQRYEAKLNEEARQRSYWQQQAKKETAARRQLQQDLDAKEADWALREVAIKVGVRDVDYAIRLLTRDLEAKDEKALEGFDEQKFFEGLRTSHPYLFGETVVPAQTGPTGTTTKPKPPSSTEATRQGAAAGRIDVRKMNPQEYQAYLASKGLRNPAAG